MVLARDGGVLVHSVVLRLLLPSRVILSIRILPEGYEIIDIADQPKLDVQTERADDCVVYEDFMKTIKGFKDTNVPKSLYQLVFASITDLFAASRRCGI